MGANGAGAADAAIAPRIMPRSVRLEVSLRIESPSARFGPAHCQNSAPAKSAPNSDAIFAPQTVKPKVTLQGWWPAVNTAIERSPIRIAPTTNLRDGVNDAPRRRAMAAATTAARPRLAQVAARPPQGPR